VKVAFTKTGQRRYRVSIERELGPDLTCVGAPGYDDRLPHDLLHFVAEAVWEMRGGVFAGLATADDAGGFFPTDQALVGKWMRRRRRKPQPRPKGRRSELLAGVLERAWKERRLRVGVRGRQLLLPAGGRARRRGAARASARLVRRARRGVARAARRRLAHVGVAPAGEPIA